MLLFKSRPPVTLSVDSVAAMAPDQSSLAAARKLLGAASWPVRAVDGAGLAWGECQGSGSAPYRIAVSIDDLGYKCTCPSRKLPCKHTLALIWHLAERPADFTTSAVPEWVVEWAVRRKPKGAPVPRRVDGPAPSLVEPPAEQERDPSSEARS